MELATLNRIFLEQEVQRITDGNLQKFLMATLDDFPEYFWEAPASVNWYHPEDERKAGGLVLHTRRVCKLVDDFVRFYNLSLWEQDILLASAILHDSFARGIPPKDIKASDVMHPLYPLMQFPYNGYADRFHIDASAYHTIMECVSSHSGRWSVNPLLNSNKKLPVIFQTMDYIASRVHIEVKL